MPRAKPQKPPPPTAAATRLGLLLAQARKDRGLSQEQLAERIGVHRNTVWGFEQGNSLSLDLFFKVCDALEIDAKEMTQRMIDASSEQ